MRLTIRLSQYCTGVKTKTISIAHDVYDVDTKMKIFLYCLTIFAFCIVL